MKEGSVDDDEVEKKDERPLYFAKIVVVGDCGVGKTSLMRAFFDADFSQSYMATVGVDFRIATIPLDDIDVKVHVGHGGTGKVPILDGSVLSRCNGHRNLLRRIAR